MHQALWMNQQAGDASEQHKMMFYHILLSQVKNKRENN